MGEPAKQRLRQQFAALDPVALLKAIRDTQQQLAAIGDGNASPEPPTDIAVFLHRRSRAIGHEGELDEALAGSRTGRYNRGR